jgi:DNA (cytosine-5)-methyltransferase 1
MIKILDVCSGIGGFSLGLEATGGFDTVAFCEYDEFCRKVLNKHWPEVPIYKDLKEIGNEPTRLIQEFDLICGGIPCQPFSLAGKQKGKEDDRHLWPYMYEIIKHKKPTWVIVENVGGFVNVALDDVCLNLETEGYATQSFIIPACGVSAPHRRERIWILGKLMDDSKRNEHIEEIRGGNGEEREDEKRQGEEHSTSRISSGASGLRVSNQGHEGSRDVADTESNIEDGVSRKSESEHDQGDTRLESECSDNGRIERGSTQDVADSNSGHDNGEKEEVRTRGQASDDGSTGGATEDVADSSSEGSQGHRGEHGLRETSEEEQTSRSSQEQDVSHAKELDRDVDDNGHSGQDDGQQRQGLQGELGGASSNRGEHVADSKRNEHIGEVRGGLGEEGEDAQQERQEDSTSGISSRTSAVRLSDNGHAAGEDVANTERLGQQGQGEHERPSDTEKDSEGQASGTDDGSQGQTWQGHTEPRVGGMADGISARLDGHYRFEREPNIPRVATGIPERVNRLKALGNSIVPQVIYNIGLAILEEEERTNVAD